MVNTGSKVPCKLNVSALLLLSWAEAACPHRASWALTHTDHVFCWSLPETGKHFYIHLSQGNWEIKLRVTHPFLCAEPRASCGARGTPVDSSTLAVESRSSNQACSARSVRPWPRKEPQRPSGPHILSTNSQQPTDAFSSSPRNSDWGEPWTNRNVFFIKRHLKI